MCSRFEDGTAACATHLSTDRSVSPRQCRELMDTHLPASTGDDAIIVSGAVQQVMASSAGFDLVATDLIDMEGTTDHPGLLVRLSRGETTPGMTFQGQRPHSRTVAP
jgi:hypothetical protein